MLVNKLLSNKKIKKIIVVDTFWFGNFLKKNNKIKILKKNIFYNLKSEEVKNVDSIIHLGEIANDPASELRPKLTWENSCLGMRNLCEISKKNKIKKFIYASSGSVYGIKKEKKVNELLELNPISDYNKTKMVTERILQVIKNILKFL